MSCNSTFWKPFLAGALASASLLWLVPKVVREVSKPRRCKKKKEEEDELFDSAHLENRMIRKAEGALRKRTSRVTAVVERCTNNYNYSAILRTAEALGIQNVFIIGPPKQQQQQQQQQNDNDDCMKMETMKGRVIKLSPEEAQDRKMHHLFARNAMEWLTVREFGSTKECVEELKKTGHTIWATDLSQRATCLTKEGVGVLPKKIAIVFGTEAVGCSQEMLDAADERVYLPLRGFADSLNLSVATALVLHQLFVLDPSIEGCMSETERRSLRTEWYSKLVTNRLMTSSQKKQRARLLSHVQELHQLEQQQQTTALQPAQVEKMARYRPMERELYELEQSFSQQAQAAVQHLIDDPPEPITDMRRADPHRTWFGTKQKYQAMSGPEYDTAEGFSTAQYFRARIPEEPPSGVVIEVPTTKTQTSVSTASTTTTSSTTTTPTTTTTTKPKRSKKSRRRAAKAAQKAAQADTQQG